MTGTYITFVNFERYKEMMKKILDEVKPENYDIIVGLHRGGNIPAIHLSHKLNIPCISIDWSLRDGNITDRSLADANILSNLVHKDNKRVLIVDDIIDSGDSLRTLLDRANIPRLQVGIASLIYNDEQMIVPNAYGRKISRSTHKDWFEFWWEF